MKAEEAIMIMSEQADKWRKRAQILTEGPLDAEGRLMNRAKESRKKAEAADVLVKIARAWMQEGKA